MSGPHIKVLIVGGGIAGPGLVYWLTKTKLNCSITLVERSPEPRVTGQAVDIRGAAVDVIRRMGLDQTIRDQHTTETGLCFVDTTGKRFAQFDSTGDEKHQSATSEYEILRADLAKIFLDVTTDLPGVNYRYGESVSALEPVEDGNNVTFTSSPGKTEFFNLVVAADGSTSRTRSLIFDEAVSKAAFEFLGQYIAFFSVPSQDGDPKLWQWYNADKGRLVSLRPHKDPSTMGAYLGITTPAKGIEDPEVEAALAKGNEACKALLLERFNDAGWQSPRILDGMTKTKDFYMSRSCIVTMPVFHNSRNAVLIGDAATASFGVGTSYAIQSPYILAGELSKISSVKEIPEALARYEKEFRVYSEQRRSMPGGLQIANPQTKLGLTVMKNVVWAMSWLRVDKLFGVGEKVKSMPEYEWVGLPEVKA